MYCKNCEESVNLIFRKGKFSGLAGNVNVRNLKEVFPDIRVFKYLSEVKQWNCCNSENRIDTF